MAILKNLFGYLSSVTRKAPTHQREAGATGLSIRMPCSSDTITVTRPVSPHTALCVATAFRCVRLLSESVAQLPLRVMERRGSIFVPGGEDSTAWLLEAQPCPGWSAFDYWVQVVADVLLTGNAYIKPIYSGPELSALQILSPYSVSYDPDSHIYDIADFAAGISGRFDDSEVIHIKGLGSVRGRGMSVLGYAAAGINVARQGDTETFRRFKSGGIMHGILTGPDDSQAGGLDWYDDRELSKAARQMNIKISEGEGIIPVYGATKFTPFSLSSTDLQFLETRKFTVREICRFFGVHPSFVFDDTSNNYKSAEMANVAFLSNTLNPLLRKIEVELTRKLVGIAGFRRMRYEFDRHSLYLCDLAGRSAFLKSILETGGCVNDVRRMENLPDVTGGDMPLVSANLKTLDQLSNEKGNI